MTNAEITWKYLRQYLNAYAVAGIMGNLWYESGINPKNLQQTYEKRLGMTDSSYTNAVDNGSYTRFASDSAGYGIAQWTSSGRKKNLLNFAKSSGKSIGDLEMQCAFLIKELNGDYNKSCGTPLKSVKSVREASDIILKKFERPANQGTSVQQKRAAKGQEFYNQFNSQSEQQEGGTTTVGKYDKYIKSTGTHYISNSGSNENKGYHGGKAGDQTGHEWELKGWYNRPWSVVLRYPNQAVGLKIAELSCAAALNNKIGYDQNTRNTYWKQLQAVGYDPSKITVACNDDCTSGVSANVKAAGHLLGITSLANVSISSSRDMKANFTKVGFQALTDSKYRTSAKYLLPGDILLYEGHHAAANVTIGSAVRSSWNPGDVEKVPIVVKEYKLGERTLRKGDTGKDVAELQLDLIKLGYALPKYRNDGSYGNETIAAVKQFQKDHNLTVDGIAGPKTISAIKKLI